MNFPNVQTERHKNELLNTKNWNCIILQLFIPYVDRNKVNCTSMFYFVNF